MTSPSHGENREWIMTYVRFTEFESPPAHHCFLFHSVRVITNTLAVASECGAKEMIQLRVSSGHHTQTTKMVFRNAKTDL